MKLNGSNLEFYDLKEFYRFVHENGLFGNIQLEMPIKDNTGKILIKEQVNLKEGTLKKLETLEGQYEVKFLVKMNSDLLERLKEKICGDLVPKIEKAKIQFINYLFDNNVSSLNNYKGFFQSSLYKTEIVTYLFSLKVNNPEYFDYILELSLLVLGVLVQKSYQIRFLNRNGFLAGLFCDLALSEVDYWKKPFSNEADMREVAKLSSSLAMRFKLSSEITIPIQNQSIPGIISDSTNREIDFEIIRKHPLFGVNFGSEGEEDTEVNPEAITIITDALKIARFIVESEKKIDAKENKSESLILMLTYNTQKGIFSKELAEPVIDRFKEFEKKLSRLRKIVAMESKCMFPQSAWAYPKPNATQILCKNKVYSCPHFLSGWDINIITSQSSYGYIGTALTPGMYPKCKLEKNLQEELKSFEKE